MLQSELRRPAADIELHRGKIIHFGNNTGSTLSKGCSARLSATRSTLQRLLCECHRGERERERGRGGAGRGGSHQADMNLRPARPAATASYLPQQLRPRPEWKQQLPRVGLGIAVLKGVGGSPVPPPTPPATHQHTRGSVVYALCKVRESVPLKGRLAPGAFQGVCIGLLLSH